jgi:glycogen synthase
VGGTPVVAFSTGGLKDSVFEYMWDSEIGSGFTFLAYKRDDFLYAIERAMGTFRNKQKYLKLRENAFNATMSGEIVTKAWLQEFYRLRQKVYFDFHVKENQMRAMASWDPNLYSPLNIFEEIFGQETKEKYHLDDLDFGAEETK